MVIFQIALQPLHALRIEVIGRFVEEHDIRGGQQDQRYQDAHLPATGKFSAVLRRNPFPETRSRLYLLRLCVESVSFGGLKTGSRDFVCLHYLLILG